MKQLGRTTRRVVVAVTGLVAALASCSSGGETAPDPAEPARPPTAAAPPLGLDVRYVDDEGNFKVLRVPDFPR